MIIDVFKKYFNQKFPNTTAEKLAWSYADTFRDFIKSNMNVNGKEDYPYYNIGGKKYNAMFYIDDPEWIKNHIKGNSNNIKNSSVAALLNKFAKKADNVVIEFFIDDPESELIKKENKIETNTLYIAEDLKKIIGNNKNEFLLNIMNILKNKGIINIEEPTEQIIIGGDDENNINYDEIKTKKKEKKSEETNTEIEIINHGFDNNGIHFFTKTKFNLLGYDKDGYDADGFDIKGVSKEKTLN